MLYFLFWKNVSCKSKIYSLNIMVRALMFSWLILLSSSCCSSKKNLEKLDVWSSNPSTSSTRIKIESDLSSSQIRLAFMEHLQKRNIEYKELDGASILTLPFKEGNRMMRVRFIISNNKVILSGDQDAGSLKPNSYNWTEIKKSSEGIGSPWWEVLTVFGYVVQANANEYTVEYN